MHGAPFSSQWGLSLSSSGLLAPSSWRPYDAGSKVIRARAETVQTILLPGEGFWRLPSPSAGDIFFDLEGDPFVADGGLEYLFGYSVDDGEYRAAWALDREAEKAIFEKFIDSVVAGLARHPNLHVYHYAPYE